MSSSPWLFQRKILFIFFLFQILAVSVIAAGNWEVSPAELKAVYNAYYAVDNIIDMIGVVIRKQLKIVIAEIEAAALGLF